jgi:hypothetical protein
VQHLTEHMLGLPSTSAPTAAPAMMISSTGCQIAWTVPPIMKKPPKTLPKTMKIPIIAMMTAFPRHCAASMMDLLLNSGVLQHAFILPSAALFSWQTRASVRSSTAAISL